VTTTTTAPARAPRLSFGGILTSEWIKFWTLRSTVWCCAILVILLLGIGLLAGQSSAFGGGTIPFAQQQAQAMLAATAGLRVAELVLSVLGVLVISGEYGTGMIRSTLTAVPKRIPALLAKGLVLAIVAFVLGLISTYATALLQAPLLDGSGIHTDFSDLGVNLSLLGGALYVTLIALTAFGIGAIVRNSAGGIATSLGVLLVAPVVLQLVGALTRSNWVSNVGAFLPTSAGSALFAYPTKTPQVVQGLIQLNGIQGGLVLLAWAALLIALAGILLKRRDV
jgi:ABC-2 type transport system permease protein